MMAMIKPRMDLRGMLFADSGGIADAGARRLPMTKSNTRGVVQEITVSSRAISTSHNITPAEDCGNRDHRSKTWPYLSQLAGPLSHILQISPNPQRSPLRLGVGDVVAVAVVVIVAIRLLVVASTSFIASLIIMPTSAR